MVWRCLSFSSLAHSLIPSSSPAKPASKGALFVCAFGCAFASCLLEEGGKQGRRRAQAVQLHHAGMRAGFSFFLCVCVCVFEGVLHFPHSQHSFRQLPSKPISQPRLSLSCLVCCCFVFSFPPLAPFFLRSFNQPTPWASSLSLARTRL